MIPKIWNKKLKKCSKCGDKSKLNGWVTQRKWADDIGGRIFCPMCNKIFEVQEFGKSRYKVWKMLVDGWNNINQSGERII